MPGHVYAFVGMGVEGFRIKNPYSTPEIPLASYKQIAEYELQKAFRYIPALKSTLGEYVYKDGSKT